MKNNIIQVPNRIIRRYGFQGKLHIIRVYYNHYETDKYNEKKTHDYNIKIYTQEIYYINIF